MIALRHKSIVLVVVLLALIPTPTFEQGLPFPGGGMIHAVSGGASWTITNQKNGTAVAGTGSPDLAAAAFDNPLTNGSTILCVVFNVQAGDTLTCTDTASNTYGDCGLGATAAQLASSAETKTLCAANSSTTSSNVVTMHSDVSTSYPRIIAIEVTGGAASAVDTGSKIENQTSSAGSSDNALAASVTPSTNDSFIFCGFADSTDQITVGVSPAMTSVSSLPNLVAEYYIQATAAAFVCKASEPTSALDYGAMVVVLKH